MNRSHKKIDPKEWYTMSDIWRVKMFSWTSSLWAIRNVVALDRRSKNILKANITGTGRATKYHFKGENILKFISEFESGKIQI